jgi:hypothetical protein
MPILQPYLQIDGQNNFSLNFFLKTSIHPSDVYGKRTAVSLKDIFVSFETKIMALSI